ncbi:MAG: D-inositol-3-phosphate glycosyltransferase [Myxococcota bacterium]|nr:D-inositol-3-phosphate glycosyltransferase [Myxococcota bacterium]
MLLVLNSTQGGANISAAEFVEELTRRHGVQFSVAYHNPGVEGELERFRACSGAVEPMYLAAWNCNYRLTPAQRMKFFLGRNARNWFRTKAVARMIRFIRQVRPDIIHTNTSLNLEGALAAKILGIPHLWHVRELIGDDKEFRFHLPVPQLVRLMGNLGKLIVCNSEATAEPFRKHLPRGQVRVIYNAVKPGDFDEDARRRGRELRKQWTQGTDRSVVIGLAANVSSPSKRHDLFISIAARVVRENPDAWFVILGDIPEPSDKIVFQRYQGFVDLARKSGAASRIVWAGYHKDMAAALSGLDFLVHCSAQESFGRVIAEGMTAGAAILAPRANVMTELIREGSTGFLYEQDNADDAARILLELIRKPELCDEVRSRASPEAVTRFGLARLGDEMMDAYQHMVKV